MIFGCANDEQFYDELHEDFEEEYLFDYEQNYCESSPYYYCDNHTCEKKEFNYKCLFKFK